MPSARKNKLHKTATYRTQKLRKPNNLKSVNKISISDEDFNQLAQKIVKLNSQIKSFKSKLVGNKKTSAYKDPYVLKRMLKLRELYQSYPELRKYKYEKNWSTVKMPIKELDAFSNNLINDIKNRFSASKKDIIIFNDITPLINNIDFIEYALQERIKFTSIDNPKIAESFSDTIIYLSSKFEKNLGGNRNAGKRIKNEANQFAKKIGPKLDELDEKGHLSYGSKASFLNENEIKTLRGKNWTRTAVKMVWERWGKLKNEEESNNDLSSKKPKPE